MNILSYRGPNSSDPETAALSKLFVSRKEPQHQWWFMEENSFHCCGTKSTYSHCICDFPETVVQGHYNYCNKFLKPIFQQSDGPVHFSQTDRDMFHQFNSFFSKSMLGFDQLSIVHPIIVSGYHLALCPQILYNCSGSQSTYFWNLPWPKEISRIYVPFVSEIALGLLHADTLGFVDSEYASNFLSFVNIVMPNYNVNIMARKVDSIHEPEHSTLVKWIQSESEFSNN